MAVDVLGTGVFEDWYLELSDSDATSVDRLVSLLEHRGVLLGSPYSSAIKGSRHALRELRAQSGGRPLRIFYAFDPERQAVLLIGGDKSGADRFYKEYIPRAEGIFNEYLESVRKKGGK